MANPIQLKRSTTAGNVPPSLAMGELAVNIPDRLGFIADGQGTIRPFNLTSDAEKVSSGPIANALGAKLGMSGNASAVTITPDPTAASGSLASLFAGQTTIPAASLAGAPSVSHSPRGNPFTTLANLLHSTTTGSNTTREFGVSLGMLSNRGAGITDPTAISQGAADKITLYAGHEMAQGSLQGWAFNTVTNILVDNTTWTSAWGAEIDINNVSFKHAGDEVGAIQGPIVWGVDVVAGGNARMTAGLHISTYVTEIGPIWNRGILIEGTRQADVESQSKAAVVLRDLGSHTIGVDLRSATYSQAAIALPNNRGIQQRTTGAGAMDVPVLNMDPSGLTHLYGLTGVQVDTFFKTKVGTNPDSTGQPSQAFAATVFNAINSTGNSGLIAKINFASAGATILECGVDVVNGSYAPALQVKGDRRLYLWDGSTMSPVQIGAAGSTPSNARVLYI